PGMVPEIRGRKMCHSSRTQFWNPSRVRFGLDGVPGVSLALNPRLMSGSPSGCPGRLKAAPGTAAFLPPNLGLASLSRSATREKMSKVQCGLQSAAKLVGEEALRFPDAGQQGRGSCRINPALRVNS